MALAAMSSLLIGALVGVYAKPSQKIGAMVMAFGTGALIQALALQLAFAGAERLMRQAQLSGLQSWLWVAGGFIAGGIVYYIGNRIVDNYGGALRHPAMAKLYLLKKKREESAAVLEKLSQIELVRRLPPEEMEDVLLCVQPCRFAAGEIVFQQGDAGDALYFIDAGQVDIEVRGVGERSRRIAALTAGHSFGEMALLTGDPRSATAVAATNVSLLKIDKIHFDELIDKSPNLRSAVELLNSQRVVRNVQAAESPMDAAHWQQVAIANIQRLSRNEEVSMMRKQASAGAPLAIFLGAMLDGIPESLVIGSSCSSPADYQYTFLVAVFLSNFPEAMASSLGMREAGFSKGRIFRLWGGLIVAGAVAAACGNVFFSAAPPTVLTFMEAIAGGGILAMVASVMMPEAYEHGGAEVGLSTIAGFLAAFLFSFL